MQNCNRKIELFTKIDNICICLFCISQRLISTAALMRNTENAQIGTVNHWSVANLNSWFRVSISGLHADLNGIIVTIIAFLILDIIRFQIRHHPSDKAVCHIQTLSATKDCGGYKLIKLSVTTDKKLNIFVLIKKLIETWQKPPFDQ